MAKNLKMANAAVNAEANALSEQLNGGYLREYDGIQPVTGNTSISGQALLAELRFGNPAFGSAVNGVITANSITKESDAKDTGKATWYRCYKSNGTTPIMDGSIGVKDDPLPGDRYDLEMLSNDIVEHAEVEVTSFKHTVIK